MLPDKRLRAMAVSFQKFELDPKNQYTYLEEEERKSLATRVNLIHLNLLYLRRAILQHPRLRRMLEEERLCSLSGDGKYRVLILESFRLFRDAINRNETAIAQLRDREKKRENGECPLYKVLTARIHMIGRVIAKYTMMKSQEITVQDVLDNCPVYVYGNEHSMPDTHFDQTHLTLPDLIRGGWEALHRSFSVDRDSRGTPMQILRYHRGLITTRKVQHFLTDNFLGLGPRKGPAVLIAKDHTEEITEIRPRRVNAWEIEVLSHPEWTDSASQLKDPGFPSLVFFGGFGLGGRQARVDELSPSHVKKRLEEIGNMGAQPCSYLIISVADPKSSQRGHRYTTTVAFVPSPALDALKQHMKTPEGVRQLLHWLLPPHMATYLEDHVHYPIAYFESVIALKSPL